MFLRIVSMGVLQEARESLKRDVQQVPVSSVDPWGSWVILGQHKGNPDMEQKKPFDLKKGPSNFVPSPCDLNPVVWKPKLEWLSG